MSPSWTTCAAAVDADGRPLAVTARAVADELAAAADLVKGKADAIPAAVVRGTPWATAEPGAGARSLVRTGPGDWFGLGQAEAVRSALGVPPGTGAARDVGIASVAPEPVEDRVARAVAVALRECETAGVDVGTSTAGDPELRVSAATPYELGVVVSRLQVALWGEGLDVEVPPEATGDGVALTAGTALRTRVRRERRPGGETPLRPAPQLPDPSAPGPCVTPRVRSQP